MEKTNDEIKSFCFKNGVTVYPVEQRGVWYIAVDNNGRQTVYRKKELGRGSALKITEPIYKRIMNCYIHWYEKIKNVKA